MMIVIHMILFIRRKSIPIKEEERLFPSPVNAGMKGRTKIANMVRANVVENIMALYQCFLIGVRGIKQI